MNILRVCEWSRVTAPEKFWTPARREQVELTARAWRETHRLGALPLEWGGSRGLTLQTRQWVGIVEVDGGRIEIYPKTDAALDGKSAPAPDQLGSTMRHLLRLLDATDYGDWVEADRVSLAVGDLTFPDLWAYLLSKHLWPELRRGLPSAYQSYTDELPRVQGRILVAQQLARYGDRLDRTICEWDEFSPDTPMLRLLKCACRFLRARATHPLAQGRLGDCLLALDDVGEVTPQIALRETERLIWTRGTQRFRATFELARHILAGQGPQLGTGNATNWAFLVDMNRVFERFCCVALEDRLGVAVGEQTRVGHLLKPTRMGQLADLTWRSGAQHWIGDAKWKRLSSADANDDADEEAGTIEFGAAPAAPLSDAAKAILTKVSTADVRQLTTYAELELRNRATPQSEKRAQLAVLYPAGGGSDIQFSVATWNETNLHFVPVSVADWATPGEALPSGFGK